MFIHHLHHHRSPWKRGLLSILLISTIMLIGTIGMHMLEGLAWIDAFYFMSMIATAQGPITPLTMNSAKIFASIMSFISVGAGVAALGYIFGPFFGKIWHMGVHLEEEKQKHK